ncbi:hypothetical protein QCA50_000277 [Cerrena zonata]|uniref:Aminoacyl-transfer RNA synthetases class-II family profile domain-containing protein n=1 Tax=Cerrena zonata TaxID=2478898 RepID=A0AAW0GZQ0_9APHY
MHGFSRSARVLNPNRLFCHSRVKHLPRLALRSFTHNAVLLNHSNPSPSSGTTVSDPESLRVKAREHAVSFPRRTHHCGALTLQDDGAKVVLAGWLLAERKAGKTWSFFQLKDSYGSAQLIARVGPNATNDLLAAMSQAPTESAVMVEGIVHARPENQCRKVPSGDVEVEVMNFILLNAADQSLPFLPSRADKLGELPSEELRLQYRYLDLRRNELSSNLRKRSEVAHIVRNILHSEGFTEVETPLLFKSTPEGAREFLVPTRISTRTGDSSSTSGSLTSEPLFYALPQSPQQAKQLLIASGAVDKYYQLARCFRDEDGRKDRQPEFTQIDMEMAFVSWGEGEDAAQNPNTDQWRIGGQEVRDVVEKLVRTIWSKVEGVELPERFKVMTYAEAMSRFGSDKPDTRFGSEIRDITNYLPQTLRHVLASEGNILEALVVNKNDHEAFQRGAKKLKKSEVEQTQTGVNRIDVNSANLLNWSKGSQLIRDSIDPDAWSTEDMNSFLGVTPGSTIWLAKRSRIPEGGSTPLGRLRLALFEEARRIGGLTLPPEPHFLWITEFPLFTRADEDKEFLAHGRWSSSHHPFTAPMRQDVEKMYNGQINEVRGQHYDLVLNGVEIGGGSVRVHDASMQEYIFSEILQLNKSETASFGHLLHALRCGAPPHGGIALGFDRLMAILCKTETIRDVIAFPKTGTGKDLLFQSPTPTDPTVLEQYNIQRRGV